MSQYSKAFPESRYDQVSFDFDAAAWRVIQPPLIFTIYVGISILTISLLAVLGFFNPDRRSFALKGFIRWAPVIGVLFYFASINGATHLYWYLHDFIESEPWLYAFNFLFLFKFSKVIVHTIAYYSPAYQRTRTPPFEPTIRPSDVTVIIPTISDMNNELKDCIKSILANNPAQIIISTVGLDRKKRAQRVVRDMLYKIGNSSKPPRELPKDKIIVIEISEGNKRLQTMEAVRAVKTTILGYADDHVFWPPSFLESALSEFQDPHVGLVGTVKCVTRERKPWACSWNVVSFNLRNFFACIYLERHNFECTATYNLDGGVPVISGRTAFARSSILQSHLFHQFFLNETWGPWGLVGPMKVDDDNCITRFMVNNGWKTVFHNRQPEGLMDNTLGTTGGWEKFNGQLIRWARTTYRSNLTSLFGDGECWIQHPWTTFSMFIALFFNIAILYDGALFWTLKNSDYGTTGNLVVLGLVLFVSKLIKPWDYYRRFPQDWVYIPAQILFGYYHGLVRLRALFTIQNIEWTGRKGIAAKA
jgi:hypothetical protein